MRIKNLVLQNFKFHRDLEFDIKKQNCLIYGENGTGKSSIYWALYANLYSFKDKSIFNNSIRDKFLHRDYLGDALVSDIKLDNELIIRRTDDEISGHQILENQTIYFANERVLSSITVLNILKSNSNDKFYKKPFSLINELNKRFINIGNIINSNENINARIGKTNSELKRIDRLLNDNMYEFTDLKVLLTKTEFYRDILFNPSSHSNEKAEVYRKECINSIKLLEQLNKILKDLLKDNH